MIKYLLLVTAVIFIAGCTQYDTSYYNTSDIYNKTPDSYVKENLAVVKTDEPYAQETDEPPLKLKGIGMDLDYYDPATNHAGDFVFTNEKLQFNSLFMGFGFVIPGNSSSTGKDKSNPQPTFILPLGTPVRSLVDGVVAATPTLWSGDISIQVTADGKQIKWIYETEHVTNQKVKVGDVVKAGQIIAEVGSFSGGEPQGFGAFEIGILKGGNPPVHVCPFDYLDPSIKNETEAKIIALYNAWEKYKNDYNIYSQEDFASPGCIANGIIEG